MRSSPLPTALWPQVYSLWLPDPVVPVIEAVERELADRADRGEGCAEYDTESVAKESLPSGILLSATEPQQLFGDDRYRFSWLKYCRPGHDSVPNYRLEESGELNSWRLLMNLHSKAVWHLGYLDRSVHTLPWRRQMGRISLLSNDQIFERDLRSVALPPRDGVKVHLAMICASAVAHAGFETGDGEYVASWSYQGYEANESYE
jgi:hypothetical protein